MSIPFEVFGVNFVMFNQDIDRRLGQDQTLLLVFVCPDRSLIRHDTASHSIQRKIPMERVHGGRHARLCLHLDGDLLSGRGRSWREAELDSSS